MVVVYGLEFDFSYFRGSLYNRETFAPGCHAVSQGRHLVDREPLIRFSFSSVRSSISSPLIFSKPLL